MNLYHRRFDPVALSPADRLGRQASRLPVSPFPRRLLISCTDADCMERRLERMEASRVSVVRTPANAVPTAGYAGTIFRSAIRSEVIRGRLKEILICGHSRCHALRTRIRSSRCDGPVASRAIRAGGLKLGPERLIRGMKESAAVLAEVKKNVLVQLDALLADTIIGEAAAHGTLTLRGWVHLDESGLFLAYDPGEDRFEPIGEAFATDAL